MSAAQQEDVKVCRHDILPWHCAPCLAEALGKLTTEVRVMIGNKEKIYFSVLRATEDGEKLLWSHWNKP